MISVRRIFWSLYAVAIVGLLWVVWNKPDWIVAGPPFK